MHCFKVRKNY